MHLTWRSVPQSSRWAMIVSTAIAVLPVCRSPMISSRCPRPIGVIASMAVMPVCNGSLTGCRATTDGDWISSARVSVALMGPLPSIGRPSASTTLPRNASPTGTERIRPVCLTRSPSSMWEASPRITQPISSRSRLNARPSTPPGNSSSSFAIARGRPFTRAMPSPASTTRPTSSRSTDGFQLSTFLRSASAMLSGSIVNAIRPCAPRRSRAGQALSNVHQASADGPVEHLVADPGDDPADDARVDDDLHLHGPAGRPRKGSRQPLAVLLVQRDRRANLRQHVLLVLGRDPSQRLDDPRQLARAALIDQEPQDVHRLRVRALPEQVADQALLVLRRERRIRERLAELRSGLESLCERVQLVLHGEQLALGLNHLEQRPGVSLDQRVLLSRHSDPSRCPSRRPARCTPRSDAGARHRRAPSPPPGSPDRPRAARPANAARRRPGRARPGSPPGRGRSSPATPAPPGPAGPGGAAPPCAGPPR